MEAVRPAVEGRRTPLAPRMAQGLPADSSRRFILKGTRTAAAKLPRQGPCAARRADTQSHLSE